MITEQKIEQDDDEAFMRSLTRCDEDRRRPGVPWNRGYRWFRSVNVIPLERYRGPGTEPAVPHGAIGSASLTQNLRIAVVKLGGANVLNEIE
jgi:hypothetical protein